MAEEKQPEGKQEKTAEKPAAKPAEAAPPKAAEKPAAKPAETAPPKAAEKPAAKPAEAAPPKAAEKPAAKPAETAATKPEAADTKEAADEKPAYKKPEKAIKNVVSLDDVPADVVTLREMLEAGVHFGHRKNRWNPKMRPYIFGVRNGIHIIDLRITLKLFREAYRVTMNAVANGGTVLFVGTKKQAQDVIKEEAERCGMYYVTHRWLGGTLTNFQTIKASIERLKAIEKMAEDGTFEKLTKKEVIKKERERDKLLRNLGGIRDMKGLPSVLFTVDPLKERIAVNEAKKLKMSVIAIADTNADPESLDYVIPGNDDAIRSVRLFASKIADACIEGARLGRERAVGRAVTDKESPDPDTIRVASGGDGPKVEVISRRVRPVAVDPEATGSPEE